MKTEVWSFLLLAFRVSCPQAFRSETPSTLRRVVSEASFFPLSSAPKGPPQFSRSTPLKYRELDEDDDEAAMLKVQTRAPLGFDMKENLRRERQSGQPRSTALNFPLIRALLLNQVFILVAATVATAVLLFVTDGFEFISHWAEILQWTEGGVGSSSNFASGFLGGALGAIPIIILGNQIESSDDRTFANINFSTIVMSMTLFGRRKAPIDDFRPDELKGKMIRTTNSFDAFLQSFALAAVTGICEESVFRMEVPALIAHYFGGSPLIPLLGAAALFGLGHMQGSMNLLETGVVVGLQSINGVLFGLIYILSGGNIVSCMVAHALYDLVVFFKTWIDSNSQIEYAEAMYRLPLPADIQLEVDELLASNRSAIDLSKFKAVKKLFFTFDFDKNKTLSKSEVRKGFSYLALEKAGAPPPQQQVDQLFDQYTSEADKSRLSFSDFLRLYTRSDASA